MKSSYKSPFSVDYRKPIVLDSKDSRVSSQARYQSRAGSKVVFSDFRNGSKPLELEEYVEPES